MIEITELNSGYTSTSTQTFDNKKNPYLTFYPKELLVIYQLNGENNVLASYQDEHLHKRCLQQAQGPRYKKSSA